MFETTPDHREGLTTGGTLAARRAGRIAFGIVLIAGAIVMLADVGPQAFVFGNDHDGIGALWIMLGSWSLAFVAGSVVSRMRISSSRLRMASLVVPSIGIALMLPLLIHLPFIIATGRNAYDNWVAISIYAVGAAHVTFAVLAGVRAWQLSRGDKAISIPIVFVAVVAASCFPFGMFVIPPLLTALTGLPLISLLHYQETLATREREADRIGEIPAAIARWRAIA